MLEDEDICQQVQMTKPVRNGIQLQLTMAFTLLFYKLIMHQLSQPCDTCKVGDKPSVNVTELRNEINSVTLVGFSRPLFASVVCRAIFTWPGRRMSQRQSTFSLNRLHFSDLTKLAYFSRPTTIVTCSIC